MLKKQFFYFAIIVAFALTGCGGCSDFPEMFDGKPVTKDFEVAGPYTSLDVSNAFDVTVSDAVDKVQITAGEKVMPNVRVELEGNTLRIYLKPQKSTFSSMKVLLPYNAALTDIEFSGASDFHSKFGLEGAKVTVSLSGASDCECDIRAEEIEINGSGASDFEGRVTAACLKLDMSGDSDAEIEGEVGKLLLDLSGASDIESPVVNRRYGLVCNSCEGSLSGASDAYLHCDGIISVSLSGASDLHYTGDATTSDCSTSGGSSIQHDRL